jgi:hypothetical protein
MNAIELLPQVDTPHIADTDLTASNSEDPSVVNE